jgi:hypothetical protein
MPSTSSLGKGELVSTDSSFLVAFVDTHFIVPAVNSDSKSMLSALDLSSEDSNLVSLFDEHKSSSVSSDLSDMGLFLSISGSSNTSSSDNLVQLFHLGKVIEADGSHTLSMSNSKVVSSMALGFLSSSYLDSDLSHLDGMISGNTLLVVHDSNVIETDSLLVADNHKLVVSLGAHDSDVMVVDTSPVSSEHGSSLSLVVSNSLVKGSTLSSHPDSVSSSSHSDMMHTSSMLSIQGTDSSVVVGNSSSHMHSVRMAARRHAIWMARQRRALNKRIAYNKR